MANVGIVIVSHSPKIAEGAADMVRQMVGDSVPLAWTGGNPEGGLGTDVALIIDAIGRAWSDAGVAVLVDLGGAETNSEMAIGMLEPGQRERVVVCEAPRTLSFASEVSATVAEKALDSLRAPIVRVTGFDTPFPYTLEHIYKPDRQRVLGAIEFVAKYD